MATFRQNDINLSIALKEREDGKVQLSVTIPGSATKDIIQGAAFVLAMQNRLDINSVQVDEIEPMVIEAVGQAQFNAFTNHYAMSAMTPFAISEKGLEPIMEPELSSPAQITPGKDFTFTAVITRKPHYELSSYDPVEVKLAPITITDEEIDAQIAYMAERATTTAADEGAEATPGSEVVFGISTTFKDNGEQLDNLTAERRVYTLSAGWLPEEFDTQIMGMKAGESRTFDFDLPGQSNVDGPEGEPRTVTTTVDLTQVNKKVIPAITDAWVEVNMPEAKNVEGLRKMMREQGTEYKTNERENMKYFLVASALAERFKGSIPDEIYEYTRGDMMQNLNEQLRQQGMTLEQYIQNMGMEEQQFSMTFMMQVRETLRQSFALDALARHKGMTVDEKDIEETLKRMAPGQEERARAEFEGSGRMFLLREAALRTKANKWLVDTATYEEM